MTRKALGWACVAAALVVACSSGEAHGPSNTASVEVIGGASCPARGNAPLCPPIPGFGAVWVGCTNTSFDAGKATSCSCVDDDGGASWACETMDASPPVNMAAPCEALGGQCLVGAASCSKLGPDDACGDEVTPAGLFCCLAR
jgi:hypothetical protein